MGVGSASVVNYANTYLGSASQVNATGSVGDFEVIVSGNGATTLSLNFQTMTVLDPRITFSRTTNATQYNSSGLLVYAPHNLESYSQQFSNAFWDKAGGLTTVIDNFTTAPDGTTTATLWSEAAGTGSHHIHDLTGSYTPVIGQSYTMSMYLKQTETNPDRYVQMTFWLAGFAATAYVNFDMQLGAVAFQGAAITNATIEVANNGWYRLSVTSVAMATGASGWQAAFVSSGTAPRAESYTVTAGSEESYYLWGAQVNIGALTPYYVSTTAPYFGPRFDYDPATLAPKGLLIEEQRTNLLTYSEQFDNAVWVKGAGVTVTNNQVAAPDGTITADLITSPQDQGCYENLLSVGNGITVTNSIYIKAGTATQLLFRDDLGTGRHIVINPATGQITGSSGTILSSGSSSMGNGWYRYYMTYVTDSVNARNWIRNNTAGTLTYYTWGAQLEAGAFPTSYIPTTSAAVTRAADNASMTGTNFSSWYNQSEGAFVTSSIGSSTSGFIVSANNGTTAERVQVSYGSGSGGNINLTVTDGGVLQAQPLIGSITPTNLNKTAATYKLDDFALSVNGITPAVDTLGNIATPDRLTIGMSGAGVTQINGWIQYINYYPTRLPNGTLRGMTA